MNVTALLLAGFMVVTSATGAWGWRSGSVTGAFVTDVRGDVIGLARVFEEVEELGESPGRYVTRSQVVKLSGTTGVGVWRSPVETGPTPEGDREGDTLGTIELDASGDVVAIGSRFRRSVESTGLVERARAFLVVKISGENGTERWRHTSDACPPLGDVYYPPGDLAIDRVGDVFVLCNLNVIKLSGATGDLLWRSEAPAGATASGKLALDADGDVVVSGGFVTKLGFRRGTVMKLSGADGAILWRRVVQARPTALALSGSGDVVVGTGPDFGVVKFAGASGRLVWGRAFRGSTRPFRYIRRVCYEEGECFEGPATYTPTNRVLALAVAPRGDVFAVGTLDNYLTHGDLAVLKLSGSRGTERWRRIRKGPSTNDDAAFAVAVARNGDVVILGDVYGGQVARFSGRNGRDVWSQPIGVRGDFTFGLTVDTAGDVLFSTGQRVSKLRGDDGQDF